MKGNSWTKVIAATAVLLCSQTIFAWSTNGHKTVVKMAWDLLNKDTSDTAKNTVSKIQTILNSLGSGTTLEDLAPCADQIRYSGCAPSGVCAKFACMPQSEPWHFMAIPAAASPKNAADFAPYCQDQNCVVDQIKYNVNKLQTTTDLSSQQLSLMFLVHFWGDVSQPLHCSTQIVDGESTDGGNNSPMTLTLNGTTTSLDLHSVWDQLIQPYDTVAANNPTKLSAQLETTMPSDTSSWTTGDYLTNAALESFQFAQTNIYPDYDGNGPDGKSCQGQNVGSDYQTVMLPEIYERLQSAAVRLKKSLETAFNPPIKNNAS